MEARVLGLQRIISQEVPERAMHGVGPGLHGDIHLGRAHAEFRRIERILDLELLDGVDRGDSSGGLEQTVIAGDAVHQEADGCGPRTIHAEHPVAVVQAVRADAGADSVAALDIADAHIQL